MQHLKPINELEKTVVLDADGGFHVVLSELQPPVTPAIIERIIERTIEPKAKPFDKATEKTEKPHKIAEHARAITRFFELHQEQYLEPRMITDLSDVRISIPEALLTIKTTLRDRGSKMSKETQEGFVKAVLDHVNSLELMEWLHKGK